MSSLPAKNLHFLTGVFLHFITGADIAVGESYTVTLGDESQTIALTELICGSGGMGGGHPGGMGGGRPSGTGSERPGDITGADGSPPPRPALDQENPPAG